MLNLKNVYLVSFHTDDGDSKGLAGVYADKHAALEAVVNSGPDDIWEFYYTYICIEKYRFNSLVLPYIVAKPDREPTEWLRWECDAESGNTQTGKYVPCDQPQWAKKSFGFV